MLFFPYSDTSSLPQYGHFTFTMAIFIPLHCSLYFTTSSSLFQQYCDITSFYFLEVLPYAFHLLILPLPLTFCKVGRQEKHLHFILVPFQPGRSKLAVMDLQIVQDQKHLLFGGTNQALHKLDQPLLVHGVLIDHKPDLALTADRRDHIDPLPLRFHRQQGRMALR